MLLGVSQIGFFYLGVFGFWPYGVPTGLYAGFFLVIALILTILRRLLPFFIERGVVYQVELFNAKWLDIASLLLFLALYINYLTGFEVLTGWLSLMLFILTAVRLMCQFSLAHTGRSIHQVPTLIYAVFIMIIASTLVRSLFPFFLPQFYIESVFMAQVFWIVAFSLFLLIFTPMLLKPRIDGKPG